MKIRSLLFGFVVLLSFPAAQAQTKPSCATEKYTKELQAQFPEFSKQHAQIERQIQNFISQRQNQKQASGVVVRIPVVIHVVTESGCNGISKAQILNGLEVLNKDFRRQNADTVNTRAIFKPVAADTEIEFALARRDPNGMATEGINRVTSPLAHVSKNWNDLKIAVPAWPADKYLNIWLVESIDAGAGISNYHNFGFSQFPGLGQPWNTFGSVLTHTLWGEQGAVPGSSAVTSGREATHHISHNFHLMHTHGTNGPGNCDTDLVPDTPPADYTNLTIVGCNYNQNTVSYDPTCSSYTTDVPDQIENFLSFSDCPNMFTMGQKMRMHAVLNMHPHLQNLISPANAMFTGIDPNAAVSPLLVTPYFCVSSRRVCEGSTVTFTDQSYGAAATGWSWSFPGGTPATSTLQNPVVTYNSPGDYSVSLHIGSSLGIANNTWTNHIKVIPTTNLINVSPPNYYVEDFEEAGFPMSVTPNRTWEKASSSLAPNPENWTRVSNAFSTISNSAGSNSLRLQNATLPAGTVSTLITPNFAIQGGIPAAVYMDIAYAKKTAQPAEMMKVYYSHDCGVTWRGPVKTLGGNQLVTNGGAQVSNFVPSAAEWRMEPMVIPNYFGSVFGNVPHVMFKIEVTSNGGGNLYIDNFIIASVLGTKETAVAQNIQLFPNPLTAETGIHFELNKAETGNVKVLDLVGNEIYRTEESTFSAGNHSVLLAQQKLSAGVYLVQLNLGGKLYHTKLLVQ